MKSNFHVVNLFVCCDVIVDCFNIFEVFYIVINCVVDTVVVIVTFCDIKVFILEFPEDRIPFGFELALWCIYF